MTASFAYDRADVYEAIEGLRHQMKAMSLKLDNVLETIVTSKLPPLVLRQAITPRRIIEAVGIEYGIREEDIFNQTNKDRSSCQPRHVAMYLARKILKHSFSKIGRTFGGYDHSTVLKTCQVVEKRRAGNVEFNAAVERIVANVMGRCQ